MRLDASAICMVICIRRKTTAVYKCTIIPSFVRTAHIYLFILYLCLSSSVHRPVAFSKSAICCIYVLDYVYSVRCDMNVL